MENNSFSETFSKNLAELLKNNNINQKELAKKIGVSPSTVSMWVTGNSSPRMDLLEKIAEVFNITPSVINRFVFRFIAKLYNPRRSTFKT